jgi:hypothetical protein
VISNVNVLRYLLLDWKIWSRAGPPLQLMLVRSLAELVTSHEHATFNIRRCNEISILEKILGIFKNFVVYSEVAKYFTNILRAVISESPKGTDLQVTRYHKYNLC